MNLQFWNQKFEQQPEFYGRKPNVWFQQNLDGLKVGTLLLPGEGEGRNALYALSRGWNVVAVDQSEVARQHALSAAGSYAAKLDYQVVNLAEITLPENTYDAVGLIYIHLPPKERINFHQQVIRALKPGGTLILEGFEPRQLPMTSGGPKDETMLYTIEQISKEFNGLTIRHLDYAQPVLDEGPGHRGPAFVLRLLAQKENKGS